MYFILKYTGPSVNEFVSFTRGENEKKFFQNQFTLSLQKIVKEFLSHKLNTENTQHSKTVAYNIYRIYNNYQSISLSATRI